MGSIALFYYSATHTFLIIALALIGTGIGLTSAPLSTTATTSVPHESVGFASSLLNLTRNIAGVFFIAVLTILLAAQFSYQLLFVLCMFGTLATLVPSMVLKKSTI